MGELSFGGRLKHAWNAFTGRDPTINNPYPGYGYRPDRPRFTMGTERSIVTSIITRIAIDVSQVDIVHCRVDQNGRYEETLTQTTLNKCLTESANIDQTGRAFIQDVVMSLLDEGCVAIVPVDTTEDPEDTESYRIISLRVGKITEWYPSEVKILVYNETIGEKQEVVLPKETVAIVENPLYAVMNEPNSTLKRLIHKLNILDAIDNQSGSGKLDLIVQVPYTVRTQKQRDYAESRRKDIEMQLAGSKYGIAYADVTEKIIQLNRPVENNLMNQIQYLTSMLYGQLGMTEGIFNGTADEKESLNYNNRSIKPILSAITEAMHRTFLSKTARTQGQAIRYLLDPFKLVPVNDIAEIADKFTRNEILSPNEIRAIIGYKPSDDPQADELRNRNLNQNKAVESADTIQNE